MKTKKPVTIRFRLKVVQRDGISGFGGYLWPKLNTDVKPEKTIWLNVWACMSPGHIAQDGKPVAMTAKERKRLIITTLMHEFGHALERHFHTNPDEDAIDAAIEAWDKMYIGNFAEAVVEGDQQAVDFLRRLQAEIEAKRQAVAP